MADDDGVKTRLRSVNETALSAPQALHHLPCSIEHDGEANVSTYFVVDEKGCTCSFRGRRLKGAKVNVPEGWTGVVWKRTTDRHGDACTPFTTFQHFTEWEHDLEPTAASFTGLFDWMSLQQIIHSGESAAPAPADE